ncbi:hypothetical protein LXL04_014417 [Taraxacum kok-saghyz]
MSTFPILLSELSFCTLPPSLHRYLLLIWLPGRPVAGVEPVGISIAGAEEYELQTSPRTLHLCRINKLNWKQKLRLQKLQFSHCKLLTFNVEGCTIFEASDIRINTIEKAAKVEFTTGVALPLELPLANFTAAARHSATHASDKVFQVAHRWHFPDDSVQS